MDALKKSLGSHRSAIAVLKRRAQALELEVRRLSRRITKTVPDSKAQTEKANLRFSAKGLASQRQRLGLSAAECGVLVGASPQSVYNWESGNARPREKHLPTIAGLRAMGKKEVASKLAMAKGVAHALTFGLRRSAFV